MTKTTVTPPPPEDDGQDLVPPRLYSVGDLFAMEFDPLVWTVPGLLVRGNCDMLAGKSKMGKTRLAQGLAWAISTGGAALGTLPVIPGDVLYLGLEDGLRRLKARFMQIAGADPNDPATWPANPHLTLSDRWNLLNEGGIQFIEQWIGMSPDPVLVVVDTLKRVRPKASDKKQLYDVDYEALAPLADLAHSRNTGMLVIHHTRKADAEDWLDEVSGSTGITAAVDGTIILKRKRGAKEGTLLVVNRDAPEDVQMALVSDSQTGGWLYAGDAEMITLTAARMEILEILISVGRPMKTGDIAGAVGKPYTTVTNMLYRMLSDGLVERTDWGAFKAAPDAIVRLESKSTQVNQVNQVNGTKNGRFSCHLPDLPIYTSDSGDDSVPF